MQNAAAAGGAWAIHGITADRVRERNAVIAEGSPTLWEAAQALVDEAVASGVLAPGPATG